MTDDERDPLSALPKLGPGPADFLARFVRVCGAAAPIEYGGMVAELAALIPGQRLDRLEDTARLIVEAVARLGGKLSEIEERGRRPATLELVERGIAAGTRSASEERRRHITELVARGLTSEERTAEETKKLLYILEGLTEPEVVVLIWHAMHPHETDYQDFFARHQAILEPATHEIGIERSEIERSALRDEYDASLRRLGLVTDTGGTPQVSSLGKLLLRFIGELP